MDTFLSQNLTGKEAENITAENETIARNIENNFSKTIESSRVSELNKKKSLNLNEEEKYIFEEALRASEITQNALDITLGKVIELWGIGKKDTVPVDSDIQSALKGRGDITLKNDTLTIGSDTLVDLGAVVKGYALDKMAENSREKGIKSGIIDLGGSICAIGKKAGNKNFEIGIKDPLASGGEYMATVSLGDACISTSGVYERYFKQDGVRYHHIIDGNTGYPAESGLLSVCVIDEKGLLTDIYSTALFVLGADEGKKIAEENGIDALFITEDKRVICTKDFEEKYNLKITLEEYEACK